MKKIRSLSVILAVLMALSCLVISVAADEGIAKSNNVIFVANAGNDDNAGTADAPVATMQKAVEKLQLDGGVIVVIGQVTIDSTNAVMPAHKGTITVTSFYDGVDYRSKNYGTEATGARLVLNNGTKCAFCLQGDYVFDYLDIAVNTNVKNCIIAAYYNDVTIGANVKTVFEGLDGTPWYTGTFACDEYPAVDPRAYAPIFLAGWNISDAQGAGNITDHTTITEPCTINVAGGTWQSVRMGDRDVPYRNILDCAMTLNISGGIFTYWSAKYQNTNTNICVMAHYQSITTENFLSTVNITGGTFYGEIGGFGTYGALSAGDKTENGSININILGGEFYRYNTTDTYGPVIVPSQYLPAMTQTLEFGEKVLITVSIDVSKVKIDSFEPNFTIIGAEGLLAIKVNLSEKTDLVKLAGGLTEDDVTYGALAVDTPVVTEPVVTEAPVTQAPATDAPATDAPVTDAPAVVTTVAPAEPEVTPSTGDASVMVVFAAAAVVAIAAVVVLKKREN